MNYVVKELRWEKLKGRNEWVSQRYRVQLHAGYYIASGWSSGTNPYETLEEAQAAVQQYHDRYIRSQVIDPVDAVIEKYCEGFCRENGAKGKFADCTGCEIHTATRKA